MRIWLTCFVVLFAFAELYQWMKHLTLPLPVYILCGALLAIASNRSKSYSLWRDRDQEAATAVAAITPSELAPSTGAVAFTIRQSQPDYEQQ